MLRVNPCMLSLALLGCGAGPISANDTDTDTDSGTSASSTDSSSTGDGDGDGDEPGDGDGDGDPLACQPEQPVTARFTVTPAEALTATCVVVEEIHATEIYHLELDCNGELIEVDVDSTILIKPYVEPMTMVELDYRTDPAAPNDQWLAIHLPDSDALMLGGVAASHLDPPGTTLAEFFRNPGLSVATELPCDPVADSCGEVLRLALDVTVEGFGLTGEPVFDHGSWYADFLAFGFAIELESAIRRVPPNECDDAPDEWFALLAVWFPSD